jgi:hypothetical protein
MESQAAVLTKTASTDSRCWRCQSSISSSFSFCVNCGQQLKSVAIAAGLIHSKSVKGVPPSAKVKNKANHRTKKSVLEPVALNLPKDVVDGINCKLSETVLNNAVIARRLAHQIQTQLLEVQNAANVEEAAQNKLNESLAIEALFSNSTVTNDSRTTVVSDFKPQGSSAVSKAQERGKPAKNRRKPPKLAKQHPSTTNYLDNVESVATHYALYMSRLKQLEGLRAALMEPPVIPSQQLRQRDAQHYERSISDTYLRITTGTEMLIAKDDQGGAVHSPVGDTSADLVERTREVEHPATSVLSVATTDLTGQAFMWGPIFSTDLAGNSGASELTEGVIRLDASQHLDSSPRGGSPAVRPSVSASPDLSTSGECTIAPQQGVDAAAHHAGPIPLDGKESAPVVMFWGNIMQSELQPDVAEGRSERLQSPSQLSRTSSFRSRASSPTSDGGFSNQGSEHDPEEAELPMWIEALAAETAGLRDQFYHEDEAVMTRVGDRLSRLDVANTKLLSRRALMVQYSVDGVVLEYREKIRRMKADMGIIPPGTSPAKSYSGLSRLPSARGTDSTGPSPRFMWVLGDDEERRAADEDHEVPRREATQGQHIVIREGFVADEDEGADHSPYATVLKVQRSVLPQLRGSLTMDRGQIFEVIEGQESMLADARHLATVDDERVMQELIATLTETHIKKFNEPDVKSGGEARAAQLATLSETNAPEDTMAPMDTYSSARHAQQAHREVAEAAHRDSVEQADDLALQQWLVAVSALDAARARKATLRTLHMEEMEDSPAGSGDEDEDSLSGSPSRKVGSVKAGHSGKKQFGSSEGEEEGGTELEPAAIEVPPNNSLSRIKDMYRQSCSKMLALLPELEVDFTMDQTAQSNFRTDARSKVLVAKKVLKASSAVDHRVAVEYRTFLDHCALRRTAQALRLSEAMQHASQLEKVHHDRYLQAKREFQHSTEAALTEGAEAPKHITTSKHMRAIQKSAELELARQGEFVKALQADEAKLILDIRYVRAVDVVRDVHVVILLTVTMQLTVQARAVRAERGAGALAEPPRESFREVLRGLQAL